MTTRELLKRLPGLSRDTLYYWERRGWIPPGPKPAGKASRRQYSEEQFRVIAKIWEGYESGLRPEEAYKRASASPEKPKRG